MGRGPSMSRLVSSMARSWSRVSSKRKAASNSRCHGVSPEKIRRSATARAEDVLLGEQDKPEGGQLEARRAIARDDTEALGAPEGGVGPRLQIVLLEDAAAARGLRLVVHDQTHGESFPSPAPDLRREVLEAALEAAHRARAHGDPRHTPTSALKERQLEPLEAIERLGEGHSGGRLLRWRLEERGVVEDDQRLPGKPRG